MLSDEQTAARIAAGREMLDRRRKRRAKETAANFATCRDLAAHFRRHNLPRRFAGQYQRKARYWWYQFADALVAELERDLYRDEIDCALFLCVGSGTP